MKLLASLLLITSLTGLFCIPDKASKFVLIHWVDKLEGDFSFQEDWSYPEGVYINRFGQLNCDGDCPEDTDQMKNEQGKIYSDSLESFYSLVDTTHLFHSIKSKTLAPEWGGTNFIEFKKLEDHSIIGRTATNVGAHSSLNIRIENDSLNAWINFGSIMRPGIQTFPLINGNFTIDKESFE